jgi:eukaryotic-like serine/threonine-protein kinase
MATAPVPARFYRFGPFELGARSGELRKHGVRIKLREQPVLILLMLLEKPGEVVLREEIRLRLWPNNTIVEFDHGINAAIQKLRDALGESAGNPCYVETVARRGYRFLKEVERVPDPATAPQPAAPQPAAHADGSGELEGKVLSHYRIRGKLGEGGMGVVYRAEDLKLGRNVALKVLAGEPGEWPESILRRFEREAQAASALNHPHICTVYGLEDFDGHPAIVMELVEGETLATRLAKGPLRLEEALRLAVQIAGALAQAHAKGITHRDLKPANIMLTKSGVKVLDFGLAKITAPVPTVPGHDVETLTERGALIGTLNYMSPEQLEGKDADARSDIFAFGLVLYEMITGRRAFDAPSRASIIAAILEREPEPVEPDALNRVVRACLAKDPAERFQSARDLQRALEWSTPGDQKQDVPAARRTPRGATVAWALAGSLLLVAMGALWLWRSSVETSGAAPIQSTIDLSPAEELIPKRPYQTALTLSPDGNVLVFTGAVGGKVQLFRRALDHATATPIAGTEGGNNPFFSPDGKWLGFIANGEMRKMPANGGPAVTICKIQQPLFWGAAWGADGRIVFALGSLLRGALKRISADGGEPQTLFEDRVKRYSTPTFLPDGKTLLFSIRRLSTWDDADIVALPDGGSPQTVLKDGASPQVVNGYLFFMRRGTLLAAPFDPRRLAILGPPAAMLDNVMQAVNAHNSTLGSGIGTYAIGRTGTLVYAAGGVVPPMSGSLVRLDRKGQATDLNSHDLNTFAHLSPDGSRMIAAKAAPSAPIDTRLELYDLERGTSTTLTKDPGWYAPAWSPDGRWVAYSTNAGDIVTLPVNGQGAPETVVSSKNYFAQPMSWSPDGRWLVYSATGDGFNQIWVRPMAGGSAAAGEPKLFLESNLNLYDAEFSPDGKWMVYRSYETGRGDVFVQAFPGPGGKQRISPAGGMSPAFSRNGRELFYVGPSKESRYGVLMAVEIQTGDHFRAGIPHALFPLPGTVTSTPIRSYDPYPDGQHFLVAFAKSPTFPPVTQLNLVVNWMADVKRRTQAARL